jgi:putative PEP-CTERM system TPR-repeat lipoprotein
MLTACGNKSRDELMLQGKQFSEQGNYNGAIVAYKNILEKYPNDMPAHMALGEAYLYSGKVDQASAQLALVVQASPDTPGIALLTAQIRNAERKPDLALEALAPLLESQDPPAEALEQAGHAMILKGQFSQAQQWYEKAVARSAQSSKARLGLAECLLQSGRLADAKSQLDEALRTDSKNRDVLFMLTRVQMLQNDEDGVIETYGKLTKYYPNDLRARYGEAFLRLSKKNDIKFAQTVAAELIKKFDKAPEGYKLDGLVHLTKHENEQAADAFLSASTRRHDLDTEIFLAQAYTGTGNLDTAITHLQTALSRYPDLTVPRRMLATIYMRQNRLDEAIAETQKIFEKSPSDETGERILAEALVEKREYDKGLEVFSRLSEKQGEPPIVYEKKGLLLAMKGEDAAAEKELRRAVELGGAQLEPRMYLASFLATKNRVDEAVEILGNGDVEGPGAALSCNAMAKLRLRQGRLDEATGLLEKAKKIDPSVLTTYYNLAALHTAAGKLDQAAGEYEAALAVKPDDPRALAGASGCWEALGDMAKAQALLERAAKSRTPQASLALANFFIRHSENPNALTVLENCLDATPDAIPAWLLKSKLLAAGGDQAKAIAALDRVETLNQRLGLLEKSKYYLSQKNPSKALEIAGKLKDMNPHSGDYYLPLAEIQQIAGQPDAARTTLMTALREDPGNSKVFAALAEIEAKLGHTREALAFLDQAAAAGMDPSAVHTSKGLIFHHDGNPKAAEDQYEEALRYKETQPIALNNLAMIYADQKGNETKALELAVRACSLQSGNASLLDTLGYALLKNGRGKDAVSVLERAKKITPDNPDIDKHLAIAREIEPGPVQ